MSARSVLVIEIIVLSAWLGAAVIFAAAVAPAAFAVLPSRALAGAIVGRVLPVLLYAGMAAGALVLLLESAWGGGWRTPRALMGVLTFAGCAIAQLVIGARIDRIRQAMGGPIDAFAANDPLRVAFGRLHAWSVGWLALAMIGGLVALVLVVRALRPRG